MALDIVGTVTALAAKYASLPNSDASDTLRASYALDPDGIATPCALTMISDITSIETAGGTGLTGSLQMDVLILLDSSGPVDRRWAAMGKWVQPALTASLSGNALGQAGSLAGAIPIECETALAGDSAVYDGLPYDSVRVRYSVPFRLQAGVTP